MKILLGIPHVFSPKEGSVYSSQKESKRDIKRNALYQATLGNLIRHGREHFIHASTGRGGEVITRSLETSEDIDLNIHLYTKPEASLINEIDPHPKLKIIIPDTNDYTQIPLFASCELLKEAENYDIVGYIEDDLFIEDHDFFKKILYLDKQSNSNYAFIPHRCEYIPRLGDVILSGDPDGGRPDLFWDTGEKINIPWIFNEITFYRATNPHSGCYFLTQRQAINVKNYWEEKNWISDFELSGPLEQAGSGMLLPILKIMKPIPADFKFFMIKHIDELWKRHSFESKK